MGRRKYRTPYFVTMRVMYFLSGICVSLGLTGQTLQQELQSAAQSHGLVGMSAVATCGNQIMDIFHTGLAEIDGSRPVTDSTRYRIASISKLVTAIGLMKLWESGAFELDDDVSGALGFTLRNPQFPNVPITYRMLLSHTSSMQDGSGYSDFLSGTYASSPPPPISELLLPGGPAYTANMFRTEQPGTYYTYANVNFGVIGTLIEALSGQRFDQYMRSQVLSPLSIGGSYNVQDLDNIGNLAVLYRNSVPQADDFNGVMPVAPDLSGYLIGSNGLYFGPQGGLRVTAMELARVLLVLQGEGTLDGTVLLAPSTVDLMLANAWTWNGSNGDNYYGLFRSWGLGIHRATAQPGGDVVYPGINMFGHAGEAYGLISDLYFDPVSGAGLVFITNGYMPGNAYETGTASAFYTVEEDVFTALGTYAYEACSATGVAAIPTTVLPMVVSDRMFEWRGEEPVSIIVFDTTGKECERKELNGPGRWSPAVPGASIVRACSLGECQAFKLR